MFLAACNKPGRRAFDQKTMRPCTINVRGRLDCAVITPNWELLAVVLGAANVAWLTTL